jgi:hypothetical protein
LAILLLGSALLIQGKLTAYFMAIYIECFGAAGVRRKQVRLISPSPDGIQGLVRYHLIDVSLTIGADHIIEFPILSASRSIAIYLINCHFQSEH